MGGTRIATPGDARYYNEQLTPLRPFNVGDEVEEPPCVDLDAYEASHGRECPRVDLYEENQEAATACTLALNDGLHPFVDVLFDPRIWEDPWERRRVLMRVIRALGDDEVVRLRKEAVKREGSDEPGRSSAPRRLMRGQPAPFGSRRRPRTTHGRLRR